MRYFSLLLLLSLLVTPLLAFVLLGHLLKDSTPRILQDSSRACILCVCLTKAARSVSS